MILRDYQEKLVASSVSALSKRGNTLAAMATGGGKTIVLASVAGKLGGKQLVLQHRDELVRQNSQKFRLVNPGASIGIYNAGCKDWRGQTTFAMVQSLSRHLKSMPELDLLVIDEAHHAIANSYKKIVEQARKLNPECKIFGVTATPARGDRKGLRPIFDNCCEFISTDYLVNRGFLVKPRFFVLSLGSEVDEKLAALSKTSSGEYDMEEAEDVLNTIAQNATVIREWKKVAASRKTIVFCSTVSHAQAMTEAFCASGIRAALITGEMNEKARAEILSSFDSQGSSSIQVICNVAVLTEGYDSQPVSCIVLLRPCSQKSTMIQMIGRGLRKVDPAIYPGITKKDCLVLDFGNSLDAHGADLSTGVRLDDASVFCECCRSEIPPGANPCPICGCERTRKESSGGSGEGPELVDGELTETGFFKESPFNWCDLFGSGKVMMASGFECFCAVVSRDSENWLALGRTNGNRIEVVGTGEKLACLASADDYFRMREDLTSVKKNKRWMGEPCSEKQWAMLQKAGYREYERINFDKYSAACAINFYWNRSRIEGAMRHELGDF